MTIDRLKTLVNDDFDAVNDLIITKIHSEIGLVDNLSHHIVDSGGKRLRPLLVLLSSRACQYEGTQHIDLAAMVEFFHTATLLHDDVVDESSLRRGQQTANEIWGSKASILVGDYLFTQSIQLLIQTKDWPILNLLADTSHRITCGELKQLTNRHNLTLTLDDYLDIIHAKTAILFAASAAIGPMLAKAPETLEKKMYAYGLHLGNAFQLIDDALDYCADVQTLGKNIGDDLAEGKVTMPLLYALQNGSQAQQAIISQTLKEGNLALLPDILQIIEETRAIAYTKDFANRQKDKALASLTLLADSPFKQGLIDLALFAVARSH
ncbi:MAG: octaprenyl diphosphate synthase [Legionellaceae bacterium]|nr:octaprenyl diphosphate synthase [Legionellaceae bacterium]HCA88963.1 octaprenyl diphosphate synthase [Legionellales bacterium]|tara:strand:+ start:1281 stop:2249 length:969 start_codon:yes stop_codon:yes gene_type:complete